MPGVKFQNRDNGVFLDLENAKKLAERERLERMYSELLESRIDINNHFAGQVKVQVQP